MEATGFGAGVPGVPCLCAPVYQQHAAGCHKAHAGFRVTESGQQGSPGEPDTVPDAAPPKM